MRKNRVCENVDKEALRGNKGQCSKVDPAIASLSDEQVLVSAQAGDEGCAAALSERLGGLTISDNGTESSPLGGTAIRVARAQGDGLELAEEIVARVYVQLLDPRYTRFDPVRGSVEQYIYGLCRNAARLARPLTAHPIDGSERMIDTGNYDDGRLSLEDQECVCWAYNAASGVVRRAFARLRRGRTLEEAARAAGVSRRSLKRQIDTHIGICRSIVLE